MAYVMLRGKNGRRHEVDFEDAPVRVQLYQSSEVIEIRVEADWETRPDGRRRYVHVNMPREAFLSAIAALARGAERPALVQQDGSAGVK